MNLWIDYPDGLGMERFGFVIDNLLTLATSHSTWSFSRPESLISDLGISDLGISDLGISDLGISDLGKTKACRILFCLAIEYPPLIS